MSGLGAIATGFRLVGAWDAVKGATSAAWRWVWESKLHLAVAALAVVSAHDWLGWHENAKNKRVAHSAIVALDTTKASLARTEQALADQNAAIKRMADEATARQNAAQKVLGAATERAKGLEAAAGRIDAANAHRASGGPCVTDRAVIDARGEL